MHHYKVILYTKISIKGSCIPVFNVNSPDHRGAYVKAIGHNRNECFHFRETRLKVIAWSSIDLSLIMAASMNTIDMITEIANDLWMFNVITVEGNGYKKTL